MVERLSMGSMLAEDENVERSAGSERQRTKSDSSELSRACEIARENSAKTSRGSTHGSGERVSAARNLLEVRSYVGRHPARSSSGVRDMINRYEEGNFRRGGAFRKSPSPSVPKVSVTSTRRLKTAAELLQDSIDQTQHDRSRSTPLGNKHAASPQQTREKLPSTSSDKENHDNQVKSSADVERQPTQATPGVGASKSALRSSGQSAAGDEHGTSQEPATPLKDVTNDKADQGSTHGTPSTPSSDPADGTRPSPCLTSTGDAIRAKGAAVLTYSSAGSQAKQLRTAHGAGSKAGDSAPGPKPARHHMSKGDSIDSQSTWSCRSSEQDDCCAESGSPWHLAKERTASSPSPVVGKTERKSRSKSKARFWSKEPGDKSRARGFFDKKRTKSQSPGRGGAISALCMQTMTLSVDEESSDSQPSGSPPTSGVTPDVQQDVTRSPASDTSDKRSRRQKFLDSNWFQKPKGLFRVSK